METQKKSNYKISLTGDLGSGKSTVCKITSEKIGAEIISIGSIQRAMAKEMGMTTYEFNSYMESHPEIDDKFDTMLKSYDGVSGKNMLFDSRLAWNFVPSAYSVYLTTDLLEAGKRVFNANRENEGYASTEDAVKRLKERRASEILRYKTAYGLEIKNMLNYRLVVDSTSATPEEVVNAILSNCEKYSNEDNKRICCISPLRIYPLASACDEGEIEVVFYNDFYFAKSGLNELKKALASNMPFAQCTLVGCASENEGKTFANICTKEQLNRWEEENGITLIRYPEL